MVQQGSLRSTSAPVVPVLVSCEGQSSCTALILTGKRCEHNCSASAEQPTRCQKCRVTLRAATWPRKAFFVLNYTVFSFFSFGLAHCSLSVLRKWNVRYSVNRVMTSLSKEHASLWKVSCSFDDHLSKPPVCVWWNTTNTCANNWGEVARATKRGITLIQSVCKPFHNYSVIKAFNNFDSNKKTCADMPYPPNRFSSCAPDW